MGYFCEEVTSQYFGTMAALTSTGSAQALTGPPAGTVRLVLRLVLSKAEVDRPEPPQVIEKLREEDKKSGG
jgi:hypothetical protein